MSHPVLTLGDTETALARGVVSLQADPSLLGGTLPDRPRAVLAFADLRFHARHDAKERLRALATLAVVDARRHSGVRHLVFAVMLDPRQAGAFDRIASGIGARLHADLERDNARDVEVTFLDVSDCSDVATLTERLLDRCDDPAGLHGVVVLDWDDIRDRSIRQAARDEYL